MLSSKRCSLQLRNGDDDGGPVRRYLEVEEETDDGEAEGDDVGRIGARQVQLCHLVFEAVSVDVDRVRQARISLDQGCRGKETICE